MPKFSFDCLNKAFEGSIYLSVPGEPRKVKAEVINSTAVHVSWRPPIERERNGIIRGYQIHYYKVNDRNDAIGLPDMYNVRGSEINEVAVAGLQPDTTYQFQVAGYTRRGDGERSRAVKVKTKGAGEKSLLTVQLRLVIEMLINGRTRLSIC